MEFVNFRAVTSNSLTAGIITVDGIVEKIAKNPNDYTQAIGLSEHNKMVSNTSLFKAAKSKNVNPIAAVELDIIGIKKRSSFVSEGFDTRLSVDEEKQRHSMLFIAKSYDGYKNINRLQSILYLKSKDNQKRGILQSVFQDHPELLDDVYVLSGGLNSGDGHHLNRGSFLFQKFQDYLINKDEQQNILAEIEEYLLFWKNISNNRFFVELQRQGTLFENEFIQFIVPITNQLGIPTIATHNVYFLNKDDYEAHEYMLAYRGGYTRYTNDYQTRKTVNATKENYLKTNSEIQELFKDIPTAIENAAWLGKQCQFELLPQKNHFYMPELQSENKNEDIDSYFVRLSNEGLDNVIFNLFSLYADKNSIFNQNNTDKQYFLPDNDYFKRFSEWKVLQLSSETHSKEEILSALKQTFLYKTYKERLDYEIGVIKDLKFPSYFIVVMDMVKYAKENGIPVGIGRGSGAGSLVAYSLTITDLDPLQFDLLFERFLNPARKSMPDIDIDFETSRRDEIFEYLSKKYDSLGKRTGSQLSSALEKFLNTPSTAKILTHTLFGVAASIEVGGNVLGKMNGNSPASVSMKEIFTRDNKDNEILDVEIIDDEENNLETGFTEQAVSNQQFKIGMMFGKTFRDRTRIGEYFFNHTRALSSHASGVILCPERLDELTPIMKDDKQRLIVQQNMKNAEYMGLIKFDVLGLTTLSYIDSVRQEINKTRLKNGLDTWELHEMLSNINVYDLNVYENIFQQADTDNIFQFESKEFKETLKVIKPTRFEDLVAAVALFRPGPKKYIPDFAARKHGTQKIVDLTPSTPEVGKILEDTYGIPVYQEQIILISQAYANYSAAEADILRRAMGKKDAQAMAEQREEFVKRAVNRFPAHRHEEITKEANHIFDIAMEFSEYGFNKSHAAAYAKTSFYTAWLKHYYPKEFTVGLLNVMFDNGKNNEIPLTINDATKRGIVFQQAVDINQSTLQYSITDDGKISLPLSLSKVNALKLESILQTRVAPFENINDFLIKCSNNNIRLTKYELTKLVKSGAFNQLHPREYGNNLANVEQLLLSVAKQTDTISHPIFRRLPNRFKQPNKSLISKAVVFDNITREVPLAQQLKDRFSLFGYLINGNELDNLRKENSQSLSLFADSRTGSQLTVAKIVPNSKDFKNIILDKLFQSVDSWQEQISRGKETKFYPNASASALLLGTLIGYKKNKNEIKLTIQLSDEVIRIVSTSEELRNTKLELMQPYLWRVNATVDYGYTPEKNQAVDVESVPIRWFIDDVFPINNFINQLANFDVNDKNATNIPTFVFNNHDYLIQKYGKVDNETQSKEIINLLFKSFALPKNEKERFQSILETNEQMELEHESKPILAKLPNNEIVQFFINGMVYQNLMNADINIKLSFTPAMMDKNGLVRENALVGNIKKTDSYANILNVLDNETFNSVLQNTSDLIDSTWLENNSNSMAEGNYLLYGYLKHAAVKDGKITQLIIYDNMGKELRVNAAFGNLATREHTLKNNTPILLKVNFYRSKGQNNLNLLDFYTENDIQQLGLFDHKEYFAEDLALENVTINKGTFNVRVFNTKNSGLMKKPIKVDEETLQKIGAKPLFSNGLSYLNAYNFPALHESKQSATNTANQHYQFLEKDSVLNLSYQQNMTTKISDKFVKISVLRKASELLVQNTDKYQMIMVNVIGLKEIKGYDPKLMITDGTGILTVNIPDDLSVNIKNYLPEYIETNADGVELNLPAGEKYSEPLAMKIEISQGRDGTFYYNLRQAYSLNEVAPLLVRELYVKNDGDFVNNVKKLEKVCDEIKAQQDLHMVRKTSEINVILKDQSNKAICGLCCYSNDLINKIKLEMGENTVLLPIINSNMRCIPANIFPNYQQKVKYQPKNNHFTQSPVSQTLKP